MGIEAKLSDGRVELLLKGEFGPDDLAEFNKLINDSISLGKKQLLIDLKRVDRLTLHGLAFLSRWAMEVRRQDGLIGLVNLKPEVRRALVESKLLSLFKIIGSKKQMKNGAQ